MRMRYYGGDAEQFGKTDKSDRADDRAEHVAHAPSMTIVNARSDSWASNVWLLR